jgi:GntR family phosphonate transport system transcriptional regulator
MKLRQGLCDATEEPLSKRLQALRSEATDGSVSGWQAVEDHLRGMIERDELGIGAQIPTEVQLMKALGTSRYAVRRAMTNLQQEGLIRIEQGRGSFVHDSYLVSYKIANRTRFTNVLLESNITPAQEILGIENQRASPEAAQALGLSKTASVLAMELLGYANGQVVKHDQNFFPLPRFKEFEESLRKSNSVTEAFDRVGIADYFRKSTSIIGRLPSPAEARLLRQLPSQPIFECVRLDAEMSGTPILFGITKFSCERVRLTIGE